MGGRKGGINEDHRPNETAKQPTWMALQRNPLRPADTSSKSIGFGGGRVGGFLGPTGFSNLIDQHDPVARLPLLYFLERHVHL